MVINKVTLMPALRALNELLGFSVCSYFRRITGVFGSGTSVLTGWTYSMITFCVSSMTMFCVVSVPTFCVVVLNGRALRSFNEFDISLSRSLIFGECLLALTGVFSNNSSAMVNCQPSVYIPKNLPKITTNCAIPGTLEEQVSAKSIHELTACKSDDE